MKYLGKIEDNKDLVTKEYVDGAVKVTGVKGNAESSYRTGNVNLTPDNIGAVPKKVVSSVYNPTAGAYVGSTGYKKYARITLPNTATIWTMIFMDVSLRLDYSNGKGGRLLINAYHGTSSPYAWQGFNATAVGNLPDSNSLGVYGSDGKYIYILMNTAYQTISVDKLLLGDNAINYDQSSVTVEYVDALPSSYQTATLYYTNNPDKVNNHTVNADVPSNAVFTDTKVTAVGNHYTPSGGTTTSASGATGSSGSTVQVVTGITKDAAGHVTGITSGAATDTTYSAGTGLSLSGTTFNHSNSITSKTTQSVYSVKIDAQGHITAATAVTIPAAANYASWSSVYYQTAGVYTALPDTNITITPGSGISFKNTNGEAGFTLGLSGSTANGATGISIGNHTTGTVWGVKSDSTVTATKTTLGTAFTVPNVTSAGSGSFTQGTFSGGSFSQGSDSFTPAKLNTGFYVAGQAASFTRGTFSQGTLPTLTMSLDTTDTKKLNITFGQGTLPTHDADSFTANTPTTIDTTKFSGGSFTQGTDTFTPASHGADSHTHKAPTLGTAFTIPNVTGNTDVTVPVRNASGTTVVTTSTHTVTDNGHTHSLS